MKLCKCLCAMLACVFLWTAAIPAGAAEDKKPEDCVQKMLNLYRCYQSDAWEEVETQLTNLERLDPEQGQAWRKIMDAWRFTAESLELCYDALPQGLPEDDSLGIVIMGYGLNANGTIRQELKDRLTVGLAAARQYPDAYVIVTGGATSRDTASTEAGMMKLWLLEQGVSVERIISEPRAMSTAQNALNVYRLLNKSYPSIQQLAVITSDYHIYRSVVDFEAVSHYYSTVSGGREIPVAAHACCDPGYVRREDLSSHAADIAAIAGMELEFQRGTALHAGA